MNNAFTLPLVLFGCLQWIKTQFNFVGLANGIIWSKFSLKKKHLVLIKIWISNGCLTKWNTSFNAPHCPLSCKLFCGHLVKFSKIDFICIALCWNRFLVNGIFPFKNNTKYFGLFDDKGNFLNDIVVSKCITVEGIFATKQSLNACLERKWNGALEV